MDHFAGIDVSLEQSSICIVDVTGRIVREAKVARGMPALAQEESSGSVQREVGC